MRGQSSIEFLTTYSFMFLVLGIMLSLIIVASISQQNVESSSCTPFGGLNCNFVYLYSNNQNSYSVLSLSIVNSQSVPVNITNVSATISGTSYFGACNPSIPIPGQVSYCKIYMPLYVVNYNMLKGNYGINATFCGYNLYYQPSSSCTGATVHYSGSFIAQSLQNNFVILGASAGIVVPKTSQTPAFQSVPGNYLTGNNLLVREIGYWVGGVSGYSFGTANYVGNTYIGEKTVLFPNSTNILNNNNVHCSANYNTTMSLAYTLFYARSAGTATVNSMAYSWMYTYYKSANSITWSDLGTSNTFSTSANTYYDVAIAWYNDCGAGLQAFNITNGGLV